MAIDRVASVCAMARYMRDAIDPAQIDTKVNAAQLRLVIDTLLELATPPHHQKLVDGAARSVMGMVTPIEAAERVRGG